MKIRTRWLAVATVPVLAASGLLGVMLSGAGATTHHVARPHGSRHAAAMPMTGVSGTPQVFHQEFSGNTAHFCPGLGNNPCDGNGGAGDYGTIDRVASHFSNGGYGNYAPSTAAYFGNFFALTSGALAGNQGVGCPADNPPGQESCTGPYALFPVVNGGASDAGNSNVFPSSGFTVTNDLYLSPATAGPSGTLIDDDVELNSSTSSQSTGYYGIDNIVGVCYNSTAAGFTINFSHNTGNCDYTSGTTPVITTAGWYRFVFVFSNVSGFAELTENVISDSGNTAGSTVATSGPQPVSGGSATPITQWGGPGYFWLPDEDVSGLPLANFALQDGQHAGGYTPTPS
jgi:hypothetical protein